MAPNQTTNARIASEMIDMAAPAALLSSATVEHYTPAYIWRRAIRTMEAIDLDPASDPGFNIPASVHFTRADDGLSHRWKGRVWLNPPFGPGVGRWFDKLAAEYREGFVLEAVVLWKAATETAAWQTLIRSASRVCLPHRRIAFEGPGSRSGSTFSPALFYLGDRPDRFAAAFADIGDIWISPYVGKGSQRSNTALLSQTDLIKSLWGIS